MASIRWLLFSCLQKRRLHFLCSPSGSCADQIVGVVSHEGESPMEKNWREGKLKSSADLRKKGDTVSEGRKGLIRKARSPERGLMFREKD